MAADSGHAVEFGTSDLPERSIIRESMTELKALVSLGVYRYTAKPRALGRIMAETYPGQQQGIVVGNHATTT